MTVHNSVVTLEAADPLGEDATRLLGVMRAEALSRYGDVINPAAPQPTNDPLVPRSVFLIARIDGQAVGCAALRPMDVATAEVRRMYVAIAVRRRGIGRGLLSELERKALSFGYRNLRLETGNRQTEAVALYESHGFGRIAPYGCHVDDALSICFEKRLSGEEIVPAPAKLETEAH
jgi:GNAT superfamily N-acetyltransferase